MRRILLAAAMLAALLAAATPAEARNGHHGHHHHGHHGHWGHHHGHHHHGHWGGYGGIGWGGYGWGGIGLSIGYRPYYNYGWNFYSSGYCYPSYIYGGFNYPRYYSPTPIGLYDYYGSTSPASNLNSLVLSPGPVADQTTAAKVLNLLRLNDSDLVADLRERANALPRIGPLQETTIAATKAPPARPLNQSNIAQRRKADQQIATGDMLFREQK
ncbi:MAG: hypothetical protein L0211_07865, partial [Planctomycetaceae bacterium]|nr:hypothetical protein [Planctomycetaceae bacterium]